MSRRLLTLVIVFVFAGGVGWVAGASAAAPETNILFILDASGSMWGQLQGKAKIDIAKEVLTGLIRDLPTDATVGLMVFGHRHEGDCADVELAAPLAKGSKDRLIHAIQVLRPKGKTPITASIRQAVTHLKEQAGERNIVLVSDGKETCAEDPSLVVKELRDAGVKFTVHVVGFDVTPDERAQLESIAKAGEGNYYHAKTGAELKTALAQVKEEIVAKQEPVAKAEAPREQPAAKTKVLFDTDAEGWDRWDVRLLDKGIFRVSGKRAYLGGPGFQQYVTVLISGVDAANLVMEGKFTVLEGPYDFSGPRILFRATKGKGYSLLLRANGATLLYANGRELKTQSLVALERGKAYSFRLEVEGTNMIFELGGKTFSYSDLFEFERGAMGIGTYTASVGFESLKAWKK